MSTTTPPTTPPTTRTTRRPPDPGGPWAILAHQRHAQHRGYPRAAQRIPTGIPHRPPSAPVPRMLRHYPTPLGVCLTAATPHRLGGSITIGRAVELA